MTSLSFDAGYAMFQSDSALFGRPAEMSTLHRQLHRIASSGHAGLAAGCAGRVLLALMPFSALAWMFAC